MCILINMEGLFINNLILFPKHRIQLCSVSSRFSTDTVPTTVCCPAAVLLLFRNKAVL